MADHSNDDGSGTELPPRTVARTPRKGPGSLADRTVEASRGIADRISAATQPTVVGRVISSARSTNDLLGIGRRSLAEQFALGIGVDSLAKAVRGSSIDEILRGMRPLDGFLKDSGLAGLGQPTIAYDKLFGRIGSGLSGVTSAGRLAEKLQLAAWAKPLGGQDLAAWARMHEASGISSLLRSRHWADAIGARSLTDLTGTLDGTRRIADELEKITRVASGIGSIADLGRVRTPDLDRLLGRNSALESTTLKMSLFAGGLDVIGPRGLAGKSAFEALFGGWRTRPGLPPDFWRDREVRKRSYREADVDPGLIDADNAAILEVLVESGVVEGDTTGKTITAIIQAGPVNVRVTAARPRLGAYRAISAFEIALRGYVAAKLESAVIAAGENPAGWFKRRMPEDVLKRVRARRDEARKAGEVPAPQISFVDLGDFISIVTRSDNWSIFEPVFGSRTGFQVDLERLNAIRRPTAHPRPIDPVQLAEATLTIYRLTVMIGRDGCWDPAWDDDEG